MKSLLPRATEREIQGSIMALLAAHRVFALRINSGTGWGKVTGGGFRPIQFHSGGAGVADIVAFPRGMRNKVGFLEFDRPVVLWCEVKTLTGKQTPEQENFEEHVTQYGMHYLLARSVEDVQAWLKAHGVQ